MLLYDQLRDRLFDVPGEWGIRQCPNPACGLLWLDPMPPEEELPKLYRNYFTHLDGRENAVSPLSPALNRAYHLALRLSFVARKRRVHQQMYLGPGHGRKLLEIGCGNGSRLLKFQALGWKAEGQEVDADAAGVARKLSAAPVHLGPLADLCLQGGAYDAVVLNHVIEHVKDPVGLLRECRRLLGQDGVLVAVTPNILSRIHRKFGASWYSLDPPRHLHLFNPATLREAARRAGFADMAVWTTSVYAAGSVLGSLDIDATGRHDMLAVPRLSAAVRALVTFLGEGGAIVGRNSLQGAECVLTAGRRSC